VSCDFERRRRNFGSGMAENRAPGRAYKVRSGCFWVPNGLSKL